MTAPTPLAASAQTIEQAVANPNIPKLYANGFQIGLGNADTHILFQLLGQPVVVMNLSYTLAKTLHLMLGRLVSDFESRVGREMLTTDQVDTAFNRERK